MKSNMHGYTYSELPCRALLCLESDAGTTVGRRPGFLLHLQSLSPSATTPLPQLICTRPYLHIIFTCNPYDNPKKQVLLFPHFKDEKIGENCKNLLKSVQPINGKETRWSGPRARYGDWET